LSTCTALSTRISGLMMWRRSDVRQWRKVDEGGQHWKREECNGLDEGGLRQRWKKEECDKARGSILCTRLIE
jgi:hypothetical protein